jgi:hypothetical protein
MEIEDEKVLLALKTWAKTVELVKKQNQGDNSIGKWTKNLSHLDGICLSILTI